LFTYLIKSKKVKNLSELLTLSTEEAMKYYWGTIEEEISKNAKVALIKYKPYLCCVFLFQPLSLTDENLRVSIRELCQLNQMEEGQVLRELEELGVIQRSGQSIWIYPDLLGKFFVLDVIYSEVPLIHQDVFTKALSHEDELRYIERVSSII
jgi:hypothetical protein